MFSILLGQGGIMNKKIIVCCDGTWNEPETKTDSRQNPTNVVKIMRALRPRDANGMAQVVYYRKGVGNVNVLDRIAGGMFGVGLSNNVLSAYRFIVNNYEEGDSLYLFGFSRGAYTARVLGSLIGCIGLLDKNDLEFIPAVYAYYRTVPDKRNQSKHGPLIARLDRKPAKIKFIGVWDTVGALGIPTPMLGWISRKLWVGFHNTALGSYVENAFQALAIDERRGPFTPDLWSQVENAPEISPLKPDGCKPNVIQVWFAGAHSNVGGGYPDQGLSDTAFEWMLGRARECGLEFNQKFLANKDHFHPNSAGKLTDSLSLFYKLMRFVRVPVYNRPVGPNQLDKTKTCPGLNEMLHESVIARMEDSNVIARMQKDDVPYNPERVLASIQSNISIFHEHDREYARVTFADPQAATSRGALRGSCQIINFSDAGAKIRCETPPPVDATLAIESEQHGSHTGHVIWQNEREFGVQFQ